MLPLITLKTAKSLHCLFFFLFLGSIFAVLISTLSMITKIGLLLIVCRLGLRYFKKQISLNHPLSIIGLARTNSGIWTVVLTNQQIVYGALKGSSYVSNFILILNFLTEQNLRLTTIIVKASVGAQAFRQLLANIRNTKLEGNYSAQG